MKSMLFFILIASSNIVKSQTDQELNKVQVIHDLKKISEKGCFFVGHGPDPNEEESHTMKVLQNAAQLPLSDLRDLYQSNNKYLKLYVFSLMATTYIDSISESEKEEIFSDKRKLLFCSPEGHKNEGLTVGQFSKTMFKQGLRYDELYKKQSIVKDTIQYFIKQYAMHPGSYKSIDFEGYKTREQLNLTSDQSNAVVYEIKHTYQLKNKQGKLKELSHWFVLEDDFNVNLIESSRSNITICYPPKIQEWIDLYGKKLSKKEESDLHLDLENNELPKFDELLKKDED